MEIIFLIFGVILTTAGGYGFLVTKYKKRDVQEIVLISNCVFGGLSLLLIYVMWG